MKMEWWLSWNQSKFIDWLHDHISACDNTLKQEKGSNFLILRNLIHPCDSALDSDNNLYYPACDIGKQVLNGSNLKYVPHKTCAWMLIAALFIVGKTWKQLQCPPNDEQKNAVYAYSGILFRHKKNEVLTHVTMMILEIITLNEKRQIQMATYCLVPIIWNV